MQAAFQEHHGLQCGYCTPGMVMAAVSLLEEQPDADEAAVRQGLEGNLCRCTGYQNIVAAVLSCCDRGCRHDRHRRPRRPPPVIGTRMLRREDPALLTGEARFTDDLDIPGALHMAIVRSPYAHARITSIDVQRGAGAAGRGRRLLRGRPRRRVGRARCRAPGRSPRT